MTIEDTQQRVSPIRLDQSISYKDSYLLEKFVTEHGKILPRCITNLTVKQQKALKKAIKRARIFNLLSFGPVYNIESMNESQCLENEIDFIK
jgi:small subunit ribosomal protein S18